MDHRRLIQESDIGQVVSSRGYRITYGGSYNFLYCPGHEKQYEGTHKAQRNCYFKKGQNYCYCKVCLRSWNAKEYLMEKEGLDFGEAYDILYELAGRPAWYKSGKPLSDEERKKARKDEAVNQVLGMRMAVTTDYLYPNERNELIIAKKTQLRYRMEELESKFDRKDLFSEQERTVIMEK